MKSLKQFASQWSPTVVNDFLDDETNFKKMLQYAAIGITVAFFVFLRLMRSKENQSLQEINKTIERSKKRAKRLAVMGCTLKSYKPLKAKQRRRIRKSKANILAILNSSAVTKGLPIEQKENPNDGENTTPERFNKNLNSTQPNTSASLSLKKFKYVPPLPNIVYKRKAIRRTNNTTDAETDNFFETEYQSNYCHFN